MPDIEIGELPRDELPAAGALLGRAYRDNPFVFIRFGDDRTIGYRRWSAFTGPGSPPWSRRRSPRGGPDGWLGFAALTRQAGPGWRRQTFKKCSRHFRGSALAMSGDREMRRAESRKSEPAEPHWHLGLVGVDVDAQGEGIGTLMLKRFCERMDNAGDIAFLGTDVAANVRLYERFGFVITEEETRFGVHGWSMLRRPRA